MSPSITLMVSQNSKNEDIHEIQHKGCVCHLKHKPIHEKCPYQKLLNTKGDITKYKAKVHFQNKDPNVLQNCTPANIAYSAEATDW